MAESATTAAKAGRGSETVSAVSRDETLTARQSTATVRNPFNPEAGSTSTRGGDAAVAPSTPGAAAPTTESLSTMDVLKAKLSELGIDVSGLKFSESQFQSSSPDGRTWENHWINVDFGKFSEHFDVDGTARNPLITATEIQRAKDFAA